MQRADELLRQMTVEEKAMQLSCAFPLALFDRNGLMWTRADALIKQGIGHVAGLALTGETRLARSEDRAFLSTATVGS